MQPPDDQRDRPECALIPGGVIRKGGAGSPTVAVNIQAMNGSRF